MKASDELFQLIKSLDKNEKRYFKMFSELQSGSKNYIVLFDAIDKQQNYDEEKLKEQLKGEALVQRLAVEKVHLYKHILKALDIYHLTDEESKLETQFRQLNILINKGIYSQADKMLHKLKQQAAEQEDFPLQGKILRAEQNMMYRQAYADKTQEDVDLIFKEIGALLEKEQNLQAYARLGVKLSMSIYKQGFVRSNSQLQLFDSLIKHPLLQDEKKALSSKALINYYLCHMLYNEAYYEFDKYLIFCKKKLELIEKETNNKTHKHKRTHIFAIWDTLVALLQLKRFDYLRRYTEKLRGLALQPDMPFDLTGLALYLADTMEQGMYLEIGEFKNAIKWSDKINDTVKKYLLQPNKNDLITFNFVTAYAYFGNAEYPAAKKYLNKALDDIDSGVKTDVISMARVFNLIIYIEQQDEDLLEYAVRSTYRFLLKTKKIFQFETVLLDFIRKKLPKIKTQAQLIESFKELRKQLTILFKDPFEAKVLSYFDFVSWLDSKIQNRPFAEIVREKVEKKEV